MALEAFEKIDVMELAAKKTLNIDFDCSQKTAVSLFTGAGGLDLGLEMAGFIPVLCVEVDNDARKTLLLNRPKWRLSRPGDIHHLTPAELIKQVSLKPRQLTLLSGGPPCQPFSKSAYWLTGDSGRLRDPRARTLNAYLDVVEKLLPHVLIFENVLGFSYNGKEEGLNLLEFGLRAINRRNNSNYVARICKIDAADYGVPQHRDRIFLIASIDGDAFNIPPATHGKRNGGEEYLTAWDAIGQLYEDEWPDKLAPTGKWAALLQSIPEGRNYLWHTPRNVQYGGVPLFGWRTRYWSFLLKLSKNKPSWTIQAAPGPATGPFHWQNRLLSIEELSRLQTFPFSFRFSGSRRSVQRQIGNAVPSALAEFLGLEIRRQILKEPIHRDLQLLPKRMRSVCPDPEPIAPVPRQYLSLIDNHADHPGTGLGPAAVRRQSTDVLR